MISLHQTRSEITRQLSVGPDSSRAKTVLDKILFIVQKVIMIIGTIGIQQWGGKTYNWRSSVLRPSLELHLRLKGVESKAWSWN